MGEEEERRRSLRVSQVLNADSRPAKRWLAVKTAPTVGVGADARPACASSDPSPRRRTLRPARAIQARFLTASLLRLCEWDREPEGRALLRRAGDADLAVMIFDDGARDVQAQTEASA